MFPFIMKSSFSSVVSVDDRLHCAVNWSSVFMKQDNYFLCSTREKPRVHFYSVAVSILTLDGERPYGRLFCDVWTRPYWQRTVYTCIPGGGL